MDTPICDFVKRYNQQNTVRLHMPGHKGKCILGFEQNDITEISGADNLYQSEGIIAQSERNASSLFGCQTYYSTEGSSLCIRAMMYLAMLYAKEQNKELLVYSGRNTHKSFISACALLDFDFEWITPQKDCDPFYSSSINAEKLDNDLLKNPNKIKVVYITSPDYLGNVSDIKTISKICKKHGALLFVDNAHGAYLKFLNPSQHPIDLGADLCCDSAHKTLPVLTGGAYFHVCNNAPSFFKKYAKNALSLFGSTSPSYLILQSLDTANRYISQDYPKMLFECCCRLSGLCNDLRNKGYVLTSNEPLKITIKTKEYGYLGNTFADILRKNNVECEFSDPDTVVLMFTPQTFENEIELLKKILLSIPQKTPINSTRPFLLSSTKKLSVREAVFSPCERLSVSECIGKISAETNNMCPPAVPITIPGEIINESAVNCFHYYGVKTCLVVKN